VKPKSVDFTNSFLKNTRMHNNPKIEIIRKRDAATGHYAHFADVSHSTPRVCSLVPATRENKIDIE